jgi:hypothetical protein
LAALPFAVVGVACIVAGGLLAAVTAPAPTEHATWAAAYLVLVAGLGQVALGVGQALLAPRAPSARIVVAQTIAWNSSSAAILTGTVSGTTSVVDAGGVLLVVALLLLSHGVRGGGASTPWQVAAFRLLVVVLLASTLVGLVLAHTRPGPG